MTKEVRVRIAPSPTGDPHVGLAYTTLFNYALAKKSGGKLVLRIEDTDQTRAKASSDAMIMQSLKWLGLKWDEGPDIGGPFGPYRQSERRELYIRRAEDLVKKGAAYHCFCTPERLEKVREEQKEKGGKLGYDGHCRNLMDTTARLERREPHVIRLRVPDSGATVFKDLIRGEITIENSQIDDQVLVKSDGFPTYHLANVVDDHEMQISHVMRAEEWISSTPKHVLLYAGFGWEPPAFAHLPLLRNRDHSKISKRKNPVSLNYYRRKGILPQAMLNFLGTLGWAFSATEEIFSVEEMIQKFRPEDISLGGPVFDLQKLEAINQHYIQKMSKDDFVGYLRSEVFSEAYLGEIYPLMLSRVPTFEKFIEKSAFFFTGALDYKDLSAPKGRTVEELSGTLEELCLRLDELYEWKAPEIEKILDAHKTEIAWKPKDYFMSVRMAISGRLDSPPLFESMEVLGREMARFRLRDAAQFLKSLQNHA